MDGYLDRLAYRLKSPSSVYEKMHLRPESIPISEIKDIIRHTKIQETEKLVSKER